MWGWPTFGVPSPSFQAELRRPVVAAMDALESLSWLGVAEPASGSFNSFLVSGPISLSSVAVQVKECGS